MRLPRLHWQDVFEALAQRTTANVVSPDEDGVSPGGVAGASLESAHASHSNALIQDLTPEPSRERNDVWHAVCLTLFCSLR
jgi:hypothetical protein